MTDKEVDLLNLPKIKRPPDRVPGPRYVVEDLQAMDPSDYPKMWRREENGYLFEGILIGNLIKLVPVRGGKYRVRMPASRWPYSNLLSGSLSHWSMTIDGPVEDADLIAATRCAIKAAEGMREFWSGKD